MVWIVIIQKTSAYIAICIKKPLLYSKVLKVK